MIREFSKVQTEVKNLEKNQDKLEKKDDKIENDLKELTAYTYKKNSLKQITGE